MLYKEFLDHIYRKYSGNVKLELDRMRNLLRELGDPQNSLRGFHVAGTNGKGSVCAALEALCLAQGWSVGLNTSPHLIDYTERFRLQGRDVPFERVLDIFQSHEDLFERWDASFFEITTAIAFLLFQAEKVHTAVMEVGLGGRLDATNLFTPDVCAITTIGLDHVKTLGGTRTLIAAEKAGIIKPGIPVVLGRIEPKPRQVILRRAMELDAPAWLPVRDYYVRVRARRITGLEFDFRLGRHSYRNLRTNLVGEHQAANLGVALASFFLYAQKRGLPVSSAKVREALLSINWRGRMQVLSTAPVIIADGAHNVQGIQALVKTLDKIYPGRRLRFLISILADKDYSQMIHLICSLADRVYIAQNQSDRAASLEEQVREVKKHGVAFTTAPSVAEALVLARRELGPQNILICGGSLYTVGEVLSSFQP